MNEKQSQIFNFLVELHKAITTTKVKAIDAIRKEHGISSSIAVIIGIMNIIEKTNGHYEWTAGEEPSKKMALLVDEADRTYNRNMQKLSLMKPLIECETGEKRFIYPFKDFWEVPGYSTIGNSKRSLKQVLKENEDYILLINNDKQKDENIEIDGRGGHNAENILMTLTGLKIFISNAQTQIGRHFRDIFIRYTEKESIKYLKHTKELSRKGEMMRSFEEAGSAHRNFQNKLAQSTEEMLVDGAQLKLEYDILDFYQEVESYLQLYCDTIRRSYPPKYLNGNGSENKQLSQGSSTLLSA